MGKWEMVRLGDHIKQIRGVSYKPEDTSDVGGVENFPILRAHNIQPEGLNNNNLVFVKKSCIKDFQFIKKGDIVVCASSGSKELVGKAAQAIVDMDVAFGAFCKVVRPQRRIDPIYLKHYFSSTNYRRIISELSAGANINNLRNEHIDELQIPLPPLEVQRQIADVLDRASALIEKRKAQIDKLDLLVKSQFIEMFGDPVANPKGWEAKKLGNVIDKGPQNGLYKPADSYVTDGTGTPILRIDAFYDGEITDLTALKRLRCTIKEIEVYGLRENDIVINRVNSIEYLGKCAHVTGLLEKTVFESNMMRFSIDTAILDPLYTVKFLCLPYVYDQIISHAKKAVNQASINQSDVQDFNVLIPPLTLQSEFVAFVQQVEAQKEKLIKSLALLELNYKSLMQKCFQGEVFGTTITR